MDKTKLTKFIDKYYLGGNVESIKLEISSDVLKTGFSTEDRTLIGKVAVKDFKFEDSEFGIFTTSELIKILGALDSNITIGLNKIDDKPVNMKLEDSTLKTIFVLSDPGIIPTKPGSIKPHTEFESEVYILTKDEGGRHTPFFKGYKPQFYFRTTDVTGDIELPAGVEMVMPGDNVQMIVTLQSPIAMTE